MKGAVTVTNQELQQLTQEIVAELNEATIGAVGFSYMPPESGGRYGHVGRISSSRGRVFMVHSPDWAHTPGKVQVSGVYPRTAANEYVANDGPRIGVSVNRGARAIAREIMRRFYGPFVAEWDRVQAEINRRNQSAVDALSIAQTLAELVDARVTPSGTGRESFRIDRDNYYGDVDVSATSVDLTLRLLTPLQAARVLNALMSDPVKNVYGEEEDEQ